jgi:hypothetical protein
MLIKMTKVEGHPLSERMEFPTNAAVAQGLDEMGVSNSLEDTPYELTRRYFEAMEWNDVRLTRAGRGSDSRVYYYRHGEGPEADVGLAKIYKRSITPLLLSKYDELTEKVRGRLDEINERVGHIIEIDGVQFVVAYDILSLEAPITHDGVVGAIHDEWIQGDNWGYWRDNRNLFWREHDLPLGALAVKARDEDGEFVYPGEMDHRNSRQFEQYMLPDFSERCREVTGLSLPDLDGMNIKGEIDFTQRRVNFIVTDLLDAIHVQAR